MAVGSEWRSSQPQGCVKPPAVKRRAAFAGSLVQLYRGSRLTFASKATNTRACVGYYTTKRSICFVGMQSIDGCLSGSHHYEPSHCALHSWQDATSTAGCAAKECGGLELDCCS
jgi:hypothetical protein